MTDKKPAPEFSETLVLHVFPRWGLGPNPSPACIKAEVFLRLAKIPHTVKFTMETGENARWPYISHKGQWICDSNSIVDYVTKEFNVKLDDHLSQGDKSLGHIVKRAGEGATYWNVLRSRWVEGFEQLLVSFPFPGPDDQKRVAYTQFQGIFKEQLAWQGCGERSTEEYYADCLADLQALEAFVPEEGKFFGGAATPSSYDACLWSNLHSCGNFNYAEPVPSFAAFVRGSAKIQAYLKMVQELVYPEGFEALPAQNAMLVGAGGPLEWTA